MKTDNGAGTAPADLDAYRRNVAEAAADEEAKATRRFINAMILHHEAQAEEVGIAVNLAATDITVADTIKHEAWGFHKGAAHGLRLALQAMNGSSGGSTSATLTD